MYIEELNRPVFVLDNAHPAKKFLTEFIECRLNCVGQELGLDGENPVDQEWRCKSDGRVWTFSGFAYAFISFDIVLDGFLENALHLTDSEIGAAENLPLLRSMMNECAQAAQQSGNGEILELIDQVLQMLNRWEEYLSFRRQMILQAYG